MRKNTDEFENDGDTIQAQPISTDFDILLEMNFGAEYCYMRLTKKQAAEFASQIIEMCGDGEK